MELRAFISELVSSLAQLDFVGSIDIQIEAFVAKGRAYLKQRGFLEIYFNEQTQTLAVAWIENNRRIWGIDRDNLRGWHLHPIDNPIEHQAIQPVTVPDIIKELDEAWGTLVRDN